MNKLVATVTSKTNSCGWINTNCCFAVYVSVCCWDWLVELCIVLLLACGAVHFVGTGLWSCALCWDWLVELCTVIPLQTTTSHVLCCPAHFDISSASCLPSC